MPRPRRPRTRLVRHGEPRWPALVAILAAGGLHYALPDTLNAGPPWLLPAVVALLLVPTVVSHRLGKHDINELLGHLVTGAISAGLVWAMAQLVMALAAHSLPATSLLRAAAVLWATTVLVFASWYWRLDAGGPNDRDARRHTGEPHTRGAFLFPQMTIDPATLRAHCDVEAHWSPQFIDYLFVAFTASTAFSPTDVPVLSRWAKVLMMLQALMSLTTVALIAARAVNIL